MKKQVHIGNFFKSKFQEDDVGPTLSGSIPSVSIPSGSIPSGPTPSDSIPSGSTPSGSIPNGFDLNDLPSDPFDRPPIASYHSNQVDDIRRHYLVKKAFQPQNQKFPTKVYGKDKRRFIV